MLEVIGQVMTQAVAVDVSPMPLAALLVLLISGRRPVATMAAIGWFVAVFIGVAAGALLGESSAGEAATGTDGSTGINWIAFVFAAFFLLLAWQHLRSIPRRGETAPTPGWIEGMTKLPWFAAFGLITALVLINAKNTAIYLSMGSAVAAAGLGPVTAAISVAVIAFIASLSAFAIVLVPVFLGEDRADRVLARMNSWLIQNNSLILGVLFLILGANQMGKALQSL
ncbi:MAG: GAP family protein [Propioniciclava sp.]